MIFKDKLVCARGGVDGEEIPLKSPTPGGKDPVVMSKKEKKKKSTTSHGQGHGPLPSAAGPEDKESRGDSSPGSVRR